MVNETLGWSYRTLDYIIFPMSFFFKNDSIFLSYGKNDKSGWILELDRKGIYVVNK